MPAFISPNAGKILHHSALVNVPKLMTSYFTGRPDASVASQRVAFGTSGHRGSPYDNAFNERHILAVSQAVCLYRKQAGITGPLFVGIDTHAVSEAALANALEVFAANGVTTMIDAAGGYTPTPVISFAIISYNKGRGSGLADGVVITPSHNPPEDGGYKYNPPSGGPADTDITGWIERKANELLEQNLTGVERISYAKALQSSFIQRYDYLRPYIVELNTVIDMDLIRNSGVRIGIDPLGGAAVHFWAPLIDHYKIDATIVSDVVDPAFAFMTADWDGKIRMDCSSPYAMARLIGMRAKSDVAFANDTDADRHGIVTGSGGLMNPNHYLATAIDYLFRNRPDWAADCSVGKTIVSSSMIDRVAGRIGRKLLEVPVGFKWFVDGLLTGEMGFAGEESAGASFLKRDGTVWTTDKDGIILGLLAAEITARTGQDPSERYRGITASLGESFYARIDAPATPAQKALFKKIGPDQIDATELAGDRIEGVLTAAPGNGAAFGGIKVLSANGWFAARPSGTENVYKIYAESFRSPEHLEEIQQDARNILNKVFEEAAS